MLIGKATELLGQKNVHAGHGVNGGFADRLYGPAPRFKKWVYRGAGAMSRLLSHKSSPFAPEQYHCGPYTQWAPSPRGARYFECSWGGRGFE